MRGMSLFCVLAILCNVLSAQYVYTIKADSVKITNCDSSELIIENHTQNVPGFLFNTGNGRTIFKRAVQRLNDSLYQIGGDTLNVPRPNLNFWSLTGNIGTDPTSQFIGTRDCSPLAFRVCNSEKMRLFSSGNLGINTTTDNGAFKLQVNGNILATGTNQLIGNLAVSSGGYFGYSATGIRIDASDYVPFIFQGTTHGGHDMFIFTDPYNAGTSIFSTDQSIIRIQSGFSSSNGGNNNATVLNLNPTYTPNYPMIIRGLYYDPIYTSLAAGTKHIAIETVSGDVLLGTTSGNTGIGTSTPTAQLHTTGTVRFAGLTSDTTKTRILVSDVNGNLFYRDASTVSLDPIRSSLAVNGPITAQKLTLSAHDWPDYVFDSACRLLPLPHLEEYIQQHNHLPGVPSAAAVEKSGTDVGETQVTLLKKIEELTLYTIDQDKKLTDQKNEIELLKKKMEDFERLINSKSENRK